MHALGGPVIWVDADQRVRYERITKNAAVRNRAEEDNKTFEQIQAEAEDAIAQTGGRKFILANGCSVPDDTDHSLLEAARDIAQNLRPRA